MAAVLGSRFAVEVEASRALMGRARDLLVEARKYTRDSDGQFSSTGGGGDDDEDSGYDPGIDEMNENPDGTPRFAASYREKYGAVIEENGIGANDHFAVVTTEKGGLHVADDRAGAKNRDVLEDFGKDKRSARKVSDDVWEVTAEGGAARASARGIGVAPANGGGATITWSSGKSTTFDDLEARDLSEALGLQS